MKKYTKQYKDFLNESTLKTTWITPKDLISYLDLGIEELDYNISLYNWLNYRALISIITSIAQKIFSKKKRVEICLEIFLDYTTGGRNRLREIEIKGINACRKYLKNQIGDEELDKIAGDVYDVLVLDDGNINCDMDCFYMCTGQIDEIFIDDHAEQILLEELRTFDWSKIEKEIRGHNIFGE